MNRIKHGIDAIREYDTLKEKIAVLLKNSESDRELIKALKEKCTAQQRLIDTQRERIDGLEQLTKVVKFHFASSTPVHIAGLPEADIIAHDLTRQITTHVQDALKEHVELMYCKRAKTAQSPFYRYISLEVNVLPHGEKEYIAGLKLCPFMPFERPVVAIRDFRSEATQDEG